MIKIDDNSKPLIEAWENFKGSIDCGYTRKIWQSDELIQLSKGIANTFKQVGLGQGNVVGMLLTNTVAFPVILMGLLYIGCNPLLLYAGTTEEELKRLSNEMPIKYYIHDHMDEITRLKTNLDTLIQINIDNLHIKVYETGSGAFHPSPLYGVVLHPTSGTFGNAAICIRNQKAAIKEGYNYLSNISCYKRIRVMINTPMSHAYAYGFGLVCTILSHSELVISPKFNPKKILKSLSYRTCELITLVPPMMKSLMMIKEINPQYVMANKVFYAGLACEERLLKDFESIFNISVYSIYGTTETGGISTTYSMENKGEGVGFSLENVHIAIRDKGDYENIGANVGEVYVKSSSMMQGYYRKDLDKLEPIEYFNTKDLGEKDNDYLKLHGRVKDIINVNGMKINSSEISDVIMGCSGVSDAVVYGGKSAFNTEIVLCAYSESDEGIEIQTLRAYCIKHLSYFKIPQKFYKLDRIPRTASGKCLKSQLPDSIL